MRIAVRAAGIFAAILGLGFALLLGVGFPRLIGDDAFRESVRAAVGRELRYANLELEYFPPTIILDSPTLGGVDPFARADRAVLRVSLVPMLVGVVLIDSAGIEGAVLNLVRSGEGGLLLAGAPAADSSIAPPPDAAFRLAVRQLVIPDAVLVLDDQTVSPAHRWEVRNSMLRLQVDAIEQQAHFAIAGDIATGGRLAAEGRLTTHGRIDADVQLDGVSIAPARSYFAPGAKIDGELSGSISAVGPRVEIDLELVEGLVTLGDIALQGPLKIAAGIEREKRQSRGEVEVDATAAELRFGDFFTKPPGTRGWVRGEVTSDAAGNLAVDSWSFEMENFDGRIEGPAL